MQTVLLKAVTDENPNGDGGYNRTLTGEPRTYQPIEMNTLVDEPSVNPNAPHRVTVGLLLRAPVTDANMRGRVIANGIPRSLLGDDVSAVTNGDSGAGRIEVVIDFPSRPDIGDLEAWYDNPNDESDTGSVDGVLTHGGEPIEPVITFLRVEEI